MLSQRRVQTILPSPDPYALRPFYEETLGIKAFAERPSSIVFRVGDGTQFAISRSGIKPGGHTQMSFVAEDLDADVAELRARGVVFEEYETPKTVNGIAQMPAGRAAWFKDPHGNLIALFQFDEPV